MVTRRATQPARPTVERRIYFFRWRVTASDEEQAHEFEPHVAARLIEDLDFGNRDRYLEIDEGNDLCVWTWPGAVRPRVCLGVVRRSGLPQIEEDGDVLPLPITPEQGLVEQTHVVFLPNNIVGAEFNFYGPRLSRLAWYLEEKFPDDLPPVTFDLLLREDVQEQLAHLADVRLVQLRLHRSFFDLARQADQSLFDAFRAAGAASDASTVEVVLRHGRYSRESLPERVLNWVRVLAKEPRTREGAEVFKVRGRDDRTQGVENFDLLRDQLVTSRQVVRHGERERAVDSESMFQAIETAYDDLRESLERAAGVGP